MGKEYKVTVSERLFLKQRAVLSGNEITIYKSEIKNTHPKTILRDFLIEYARSYIEKRLKHFVSSEGFKINKVAIREQSTRWGSCSSQSNLNFNWKLILTPPEILDYVVIHELCHTRQMNHSKNFWHEVSLIDKEYKVHEKWLKVNGNQIIKFLN